MHSTGEAELEDTVSLGPSLVEPDWKAWEAWFPDGFGHSAFASPAWQRYEAAQAGPQWTPKWLRVPGTDRTLTFPVLARLDRFRRHGILFRPVHFYAGPLECSEVTSAEITAVLRDVCTPFVYHANWWVPPWVRDARPPAAPRNLAGLLSERNPDTYVITLDGTAEDHISKHVSSTHRRQVRLNDKRDLELVTRGHDTAAIREYQDLYEETYNERQWIGDQHTQTMFETAANALGNGGELVLARHEGQLVGGGVLLYDRHAAYYVQGAVKRTVKDVFPHVALYRRALQRAEELGARVLDLGGVPDGNEGLARFKLAWGARPVPVRVYSWNSGPRAVLSRSLVKAPGWLRRVRSMLGADPSNPS